SRQFLLEPRYLLQVAAKRICMANLIEGCYRQRRRRGHSARPFFDQILARRPRFEIKPLTLLTSGSYLEKAFGLMALTGRRPAEIFFSAKFSLPKKKLPFPAVIFDGQLKTRQAPGTSSLALPHPRPRRPKKTCPDP